MIYCTYSLWNIVVGTFILIRTFAQINFNNSILINGVDILDPNSIQFYNVGKYAYNYLEIDLIYSFKNRQ